MVGSCVLQYVCQTAFSQKFSYQQKLLVLSVLKWDPLANLVKLTALSQEAVSLSAVTIVQPGNLDPSFQITLLSMG